MKFRRNFWISAVRFWKDKNMEYSIYKFEFYTGVHFGTGTLNESAYTFKADQLFSALYIEAIKLGVEQEFFEAVNGDRVVFSDGLPYIGQQYLVPKPMIYIEAKNAGDSKEKKAYKKLKYLPAERLEEFLRGEMDLQSDPMRDFGYAAQQTMASVRGEEDTVPYRVGMYYYPPGCGVYVIVRYAEEQSMLLMEQLLESLSYVGIGGKKSAGLGKFLLKKGKMSDVLLKRLEMQGDCQMLLSGALPSDDELETVLEQASYLLEKRSGFVAPSIFDSTNIKSAEAEWQKKKDLYVFAAGSCFARRFQGDIYDVSKKSDHPVFRYAKGLFLGV